MTALSPPSYNQAFEDKAVVIPPSSTLSRNEAPPNYSDLFPSLKDDHHEQLQMTSNGANEEQIIIRPVTAPDSNHLCKLVFCGCCYLILAALPIAMIVIGSIYRNDCNLAKGIPLFLIVFGTCSFVQMCCSYVKRFFCRMQGGEPNNQSTTQCCVKFINFFQALLTTFLIIWVLLGSLLIFNSRQTWNEYGQPNCLNEKTNDGHVDDERGDMCCNPVLMYFSVIVLVMIYSSVALFCFFCLCGVSFLRMLARAGCPKPAFLAGWVIANTCEN